MSSAPVAGSSSAPTSSGLGTTPSTPAAGSPSSRATSSSFYVGLSAARAAPSSSSSSDTSPPAIKVCLFSQVRISSSRSQEECSPLLNSAISSARALRTAFTATACASTVMESTSDLRLALVTFSTWSYSFASSNWPRILAFCPMSLVLLDESSSFLLLSSSS